MHSFYDYFAMGGTHKKKKKVNHLPVHPNGMIYPSYGYPMGYPNHPAMMSTHSEMGESAAQEAGESASMQASEGEAPMANWGGQYAGGGITHAGHHFPGYNRPIADSDGKHKKVVLAKVGNKVKVVHFGAKGYSNNYSAKARAAYKSRHAGEGSQSKLTAGYWAYHNLWGSHTPANHAGRSSGHGERFAEDGGQMDMYANGGEMIRRADGHYSHRGLWDNIRANKGSGKKPSKEMIQQEKKIRSKMAHGGSTYSNGIWFQDGGDVDQMANGGIHIKKSHEGKFTDWAKRHGMSMSEAIQAGKHAKSAAVRKMATFADNARHWKHAEGGSTFSGNAFYQNGGEPQIQDYPDYNAYMAALQQYQSYYGNQDTPNNEVTQTASPRWHSEWDDQGINPEYDVPSASRKLNDYKGVSIVDFLAAQGINKTDYASRKELAKALGISNYTGRGDQNMQLINLLKNSPDTLNSYGNKPVMSSVGNKAAVNKATSSKRAVSETPKSLPNTSAPSSSSIFGYNNVNSSIDPETLKYIREKEMANRSYISQGKGPNPSAGSNRDPYDDSYMLNKIANDPGTPANINRRKRIDFAKNLTLGTLAPWLAEGALMAATTRYLPYGLAELPEVTAAAAHASRALPYATRALPYQKGGEIMDVTPEQAEELRRQGYQFEIL